MEIEFYKSKGFAIYILPTVVYLDWKKEKQIKFSFLLWHLSIGWQTRSWI